jgi:NTE family protein
MATSPPESSRTLRPRRVGLVLAGGAARGAYEVGVVRYIDEQVSRALGWPVPLDVLCGTSVGAINACALAAFADRPGSRAVELEKVWANLSIAEVIRLEGREILSLFRRITGRSAGEDEQLTGGLIDASPLAEMLLKTIPFTHIDTQLRKGHLSAVSVSATHVGTGATVIFVQRRRGAGPLPWSNVDPHVVARPARLRASHALASAALPVFFPAVRIEGSYYCDGGLRQNVPLSPARRLGANGLIVINPRYVRGLAVTTGLARERERKFPSPLFLMGKALNSLVLDRVDNDIDRLERINAILDAGTRRFGATFADELNEELAAAGESPVRPLRVVHIRPSENLAELGAAYVRSKEFDRTGGIVGRLLRQIAGGETSREADLLTFLLFEGGYARQLIELGQNDARAKHDELCSFFEAQLSSAGGRDAPPLPPADEG